MEEPPLLAGKPFQTGFKKPAMVEAKSALPHPDNGASRRFGGHKRKASQRGKPAKAGLTHLVNTAQAKPERKGSRLPSGLAPKSENRGG